MSKETPKQVIWRCLDFWRDDLYASNGAATPFAVDAIVGELQLAGYDIVGPATAEQEAINDQFAG